MSRGRKGIIAIASGAAGGQIISLIATPIVSRIYGPDVFGDFALIQSVTAILAPLATLRLPITLLQPRDNRTVKTILFAGLLQSGLIALIASIAIYLGANFFSLDSVGGTVGGSFWIFAMTWATSAFAFLSQAALRVHEYRAVALRHITQQGTSGSSQILFGLISSLTHVGLSAGRVLGLVASCVPLMRSSLVYWRTKGWTKPSTLWRDYWQYPVLFTPSALLNVLGTQLPLLLIAGAYASDIVGQLGMAQRIALIPSALIGTAVSQVFASEMAAKLRAGGSGVRRQFLSFATKLSFLAVLVGVVLVFLGPWAIPFFLGNEWELAGEFSKAMAVSIAFGVIASPLSTVFLVSKAAIVSLLLDSSRIILVLVAYGASLYLNSDAVVTIALLYGAQAVTYVLTFISAYAVVIRHEKEQ